MDNINSTGRVELYWPITGQAPATAFGAPPGGMPTLGEVEALFVAWVREARRRGCPDSAAVWAPNDRGGTPSLVAVWDAGPPKATSTERTARMADGYDVHAYDKDPQSGAGNCRCGRALEHVKHPHDFRPRASDEHRCVCGKVAAEYPHPVSAVLGEIGAIEVDLP